VFLSGGFDPPAFARFVFAASRFISANLWMLGGASIAGFAGGAWFIFRTRPGRAVLWLLLERLPAVGPIVQRIAIQRFAGTLSSLLQAGVPIIEALKITAAAVGHSGFRVALNRIAEQGIARGLTLGESFRKEPVFPLVISTLISVSEKTGNLDEVLKTLATFYESEIDAAIKSMVSLVEPLMLIVLGAIVGLIALSVVVPIYQLIGQF
jgi:type IV pilus assembly protein PilC